MNLMGRPPSVLLLLLTVCKRAVLECPRWFAKVAPSVECVFPSAAPCSRNVRCCCVKSECAYFGANLWQTHTLTIQSQLPIRPSVGPEQCFMGLFWCDSASDLRAFWNGVAIMKQSSSFFCPECARSTWLMRSPSCKKNMPNCHFNAESIWLIFPGKVL